MSGAASLGDMYRVIAEYTYDWESWVDARGRSRWINSALERITGYSVEECLAREDYPLGLAFEEDVPVLAAVLADARRGGSGNDVEFRVRRKDGALRWVAVSWQAVHGEEVGGEREYLGYRTSIRDIDERKRMEAELHVMRRRAEAATIARDELLANVSHELRSPVHNIAGFADLLADTSLDSTQQRFVMRIASEAAHMARQVADLLQFAALEAGGLSLVRVPFALDELVRDAVEAERARASARGLELTLQASPLACWVEGDPVRLGQVLRNLLDNALKFTERGSVDVSLRGTPHGGELAIELSVGDSGAGMQQEEIERVLLPFQQGVSTRRAAQGGVGLGLAIVQRLVSAMRGVLELRSEPGRGTTVSVSLRLPIAARPEHTQQPVAARGHHGERALVVDDSAIARELLHALLARAGYVVVQAASGAEALARLAEQPIDVVFIDYQMPSLNGLETAEGLRRVHAARDRPGRLPIYLLTANVLARDLVQTRELVDGVLEKPLARGTLELLLAQLGAVREAKPARDVSDPSRGAAPLDARVIDDLRALRGEHGPVLVRVLERSLPALEQTRAAMHAAFAASRFDQLARAAHEHAGQAAIVGARGLAELACALERGASAHEERAHEERARAGRRDPAQRQARAPRSARKRGARARQQQELARLLEELERAWERARAALTALLDHESSELDKARPVRE